MTDLTPVRSWLESHLPQILADNEIPAASVAVLADGEVIEFADGLLSTHTRIEATPDSVFQIGSITKVWTATLVMQLVDEGLIDLDEKVRRYVPEFVIADEKAATAITVRQLLSHTAGFEGDIFTDTGRGEDALELYVRSLGDTPQLFAPGEQFSYNNAGYCVLGRLVEIVREKPYAICLREHLFMPLGLATASNDAEEAILHRVAVGHVRHDPAGEQVPAPIWAMSYSNAPAGSQLAMSARDLIAFAQMHLADGVAADGTRVLSQESVAAMREAHVELPPLGLLGENWGLGWELYDSPAGQMIAHDGNTIGQASYMRIVPERGVAIAMLTNGGDGVRGYRAVFEHLLDELAGFTLKPLPAPPESAITVDASRLVGTYASQVVDLNITQDAEGRVWIEQVPKGMLAEMGEQPKISELLGYQGDTLIPATAQQGMFLPHAFVGDDGNGHARYLHIGRALPRVDA